MKSLWNLLALVLLWWVANGITSIASKSMMVVHGTEANDSACSSTSLTSAFEDLRWLELTALQHLFGAVASVIFLKALNGKSAAVWPADSPKTTIYIAGLTNVVGNLATNAAYALVSSGATQVIKSYEPIFTFFLSICLYQNYGDLTLATLFSIVTMSAGACTFVVLDKSFNVWGLLAAISSNMGFATRNIFLKKLAWESPVQKYAVISICSTILLLPAILLKFVVISASTSLVTHAQESIISAVSHFTYNTASITVLQDITPLTHATLNLSKRVFVIIANLIYFQTPVSTIMLMGLLIFFIGLVLYSTRNRRSVKEAASMVIFFVIITCVWLHCRHIFHLQSNNHVYRSQSISTEIDSELSYDSQTVPMQLDCDFSSTISTAWVFDKPLTADLLMNIEELHNVEPCTLINVYCGTSQCVRELMRMNNPSITSEFLVISNLVKDTPLEEWLARHPLYKVLAGLEFEDHLQKVVQLGILLKHGGIYIDPRIRVTGENRVLTNRTCLNGWISSMEDIDVVCFPTGHPFIKTLAEQFVKDYPKEVNKKPKFYFDFHSVLKSAISNQSIDNPDSITLKYEKQNQNESLFERHHFGALWYDWRAKLKNWSNLGDEIQSLTGLQFLPFVDNLIERDKMYLLKETEPVTAFLNAWYGDRINDWPPPSNLRPIMTSIYIRSNVQNMSTNSIDYLKRSEPIGCQDLSTLEFLRRINIESYFSGGLTLMMRSPSLNKKRTNMIYFVDVKWDNIRLFPQEIIENSTTLHHGTGYIVSGLKQFSEAYRLLEEYASAKLVITQRIHCALPCVAMGIPVIFIQSPKMPGGEGSKTQSSPRTHGLTPMFHTVNLYNMSTAEAQEWLQKFPWDNPPPNPSVGMMMRLRATFWHVIRQNQALYDAAYKFGMVPLQPPTVQALAQVPDDQLLFHLVFTASTFKWHHWRTVESIFYHHPFANVTIHSNTLQQSEFDVLTEAGYSIKVNEYSLTDMLKGSPAEEFISKLSSATSGPHWQSHQTDLLRLLVLYKWGGIYMDNDMIVVNPLDSLKNVLTWEDGNNHLISGSFMTLERDNRFLRDCLVAFAKHYDGNELHANGPDLLTNIWKQWMNKGEVVAMKSALFYMFSESDIKTECFSTSSLFDVKMTFLKEEAYAVRLRSDTEEISSKPSDGTICKHILNSFCVLCYKQY